MLIRSYGKKHHDNTNYQSLGIRYRLPHSFSCPKRVSYKNNFHAGASCLAEWYI